MESETSPDGGEQSPANPGPSPGVLAARADRAEYLFFLWASTLFALGLLAFASYTYLGPTWERAARFAGDREKLVALREATGAWGPLVFILVQALQVLLVYWPFPVEIAGGFLFGFPLGFLYSMVGLTLGSMLAFLLGRRLEGVLVTWLVTPERLQRFRTTMKRQGVLAAFMFFLIPMGPRDLVCYLLGLTRISLKFYLVAVVIARLPGTVLLSLQGAQAYQGHYLVTTALLLAYLGLAALIYLRREALYQWIERRQSQKD